jgi:hypothetical protein
MKNFIINIITLCLSAVSVPAQQVSAYRSMDANHSRLSQPDSVLQFETDTFELTYSKGRNVIDSTEVHLPAASETSSFSDIENVEIGSDSSLTIYRGFKSIQLNVKDIVSVKFYHGNLILEGMIAGGVLGFAYILSISDTTGDINSMFVSIAVGLLVAVPCALVGGIVGIFFKDEDTYDLSRLAPEKKELKLLKLFKNQGK